MWHGFVNNKLESANVDSLEFVWHCLQRIVEFWVFCCFECCNFSVDGTCANIDERDVFCLGKVEGVAKSCCRVVGIDVREDQRVSVLLPTKELPMDDNVSGFVSSVVACE